MKKYLSILVYIFIMTAFIQIGHAEEKKLSDASKRMVDSLAALTTMNSGITMDAIPAMCGDYSCLHLTKGQTNMIHFTKNPAKDDADIIMFVHAPPFIEQGLKLNEFPQLTEPPYGPGLTSGQWYYIPELKLLALPVKIEDAGISGDIVPKVK